MTAELTELSAPTPRRPIRIVLIDDHNVLREGLRLLLESVGDIQVVGQGENGHQAVELAQSLAPDVIVIDLEMPMLNGVEATRQIAHQFPQTRVLVLSSYSEPERVHELINAGAMGYLLKQTASVDIMEAIRAIVAGRRCFSPSLAQALTTTGAPDTHTPHQQARAALSPREAEVLQLISEGYLNKQIASMLGISASPSTSWI